MSMTDTTGEGIFSIAEMIALISKPALAPLADLPTNPPSAYPFSLEDSNEPIRPENLGLWTCHLGTTYSFS